MKYLQMLCGASGVLPASFTLREGFDDIQKRPFTSDDFADVYKASYGGRLVRVKALKMNDPYNEINRVSGIVFRTIA